MIKTIALKVVVKDGMIKPLETVDLPEDKEILIYIPDEKVEEYSDGTDEEWQRFSLLSFMNTEDDIDVDWADFFNYSIDDDVKENMGLREGIFCKGGVECRQLEI